MAFKNRKGSVLDDIIEAPLYILIIVIVAAVGLYISDGFDDKVQVNTALPVEAKTMSQQFNTIIEEKFPMLPGVIIIAVFLGTLAAAWFSNEGDDIFFMFAILIYFFVAILLSFIKYLYTSFRDIAFFEAIISQSILVQWFFEYIYIFLGVWFVLLWVIYLIRK